MQVSPTISLSDWFDQRGRGMLQGIPSNQAPLLSFDLAGPANGRSGFYGWDKNNFAPRVALAWSPEPKTTIRAGFGVAYDRLGQTLLGTFDQQGSFGMSTTLTNTGGLQDLTTAPRLTDLHTIPTTDRTGTTIFAPSPGGAFPQTFPSGLDQVGSFAVYFGMDDKIRTPYSYMLDFSVAHELPHGFSIEASYVGRLSHRLLAQEDVAMPLNLVDPNSGVDYFTAATALSKSPGKALPPRISTQRALAQRPTYWANMIQPLQPGGAYRIRRCTGSDSAGNPVVLPTTNPVVAAYDLFCGFNANETTAIQVLDQSGIRDFSLTNSNGDPVSYFGKGGPYTFLSPQFASLYAWRSISNANYHALQVNLRKRMSRGLQFDFNYTFSKSIDIASDAQRVQGITGGLGGQIINSWSPEQHRGVSDFDTTHQINANWIAELPFGKGRLVGRGAGGALDAIIGGWQLSGLARWTSGFPTSVGNGAQWPTNWELGGFATPIGPVKAKTTKAADGSVNMFPDPEGATGRGAFRADFPGESGPRNIIRGDGFAGLDLGLSKTWKTWEDQNLKFRWEVFNALNLSRFDVQSVSTSIDSGSFGQYSGLLTNPRVMQFALRYEF